jgi:hypothetical protein
MGTIPKMAAIHSQEIEKLGVVQSAVMYGSKKD